MRRFWHFLMGGALLSMVAMQVPAVAAPPPTPEQVKLLRFILAERETDWKKLVHKHRGEMNMSVAEYLGELSFSAAKQKVDNKAFYCAFLADAIAREHSEPLVYRLQVAREYWRQGRIQMALDMCQNVFVSDPNIVEAYVMAGEIFYSVGDDTNAVGILDKALKKDKRNESAAVLLAKVYLRNRTFEKAEKVVTDLLAAHPNSKPGKKLMEEIKGRPPQTVKAIGSTHVPTKEVQAYYQDARKQAFGGQLTQAEEGLRKVVQSDPKYAEAWSLLGDVLMRQGKAKECAEAYEQALNLVPDDPATWRYMGLAWERHYDTSKEAIALTRAIQALEECVRLNKGKDAGANADLKRMQGKRK